MIPHQLVCQFSQCALKDQSLRCKSVSVIGIPQNCYIQYVAMMLQDMEAMGFNKKTIYCAKKFLDLYLELSESIILQDLPMVIIQCMKLSLQINQTQSICEQFDDDLILKKLSYEFTIQDLHCCRNQVNNLQLYKLKIITPYDFNSLVYQLKPFNQSLQNFINYSIDFALSLIQTRSASAEQIFFSSFLYACRCKQMDPFYQNLIKMLCKNWQKILEMHNILGESIQHMNQLIDSQQYQSTNQSQESDDSEEMNILANPQIQGSIKNNANSYKKQ